MILLIDNYDSFVHNLASYMGRLGRERLVVRNDKITVGEVASLNPEAIILSPGPRAPREAGICLELIKQVYKEIPILGVCLGHQCIGEAFRGITVRARAPVHGKASLIVHNGEDLFMGLPSPLKGGRYHSLIVELPANAPLAITARVDGETTIMALRHNTYPCYGLQFHPESILTPYGMDLLRNFLVCADQWNERREAA